MNIDSRRLRHDPDQVFAHHRDQFLEGGAANLKARDAKIFTASTLASRWNRE
jgi:hypothetical protein